jgi:HEAT repeat protein
LLDLPLAEEVIQHLAACPRCAVLDPISDEPEALADQVFGSLRQLTAPARWLVWLAAAPEWGPHALLQATEPASVTQAQRRLAIATLVARRAADVVPVEEAAAWRALLVERSQMDPDAAVRQAAVAALSSLTSSTAGPDATVATTLIGSLREGPLVVRLEAARSLAASRSIGAAAVDALIEAVEHDLDDEVRIAAATAIGTASGDVGLEDDHVTALSRLLGDPAETWDVRQAAARALGRAGPDQEFASRSLLAALDHDPDVDVRLTAARALGELGAYQPSVVAALRHALDREPDRLVRAAAAATLARLTVSTNDGHADIVENATAAPAAVQESPLWRRLLARLTDLGDMDVLRALGRTSRVLTAEPMPVMQFADVWLDLVLYPGEMGIAYNDENELILTLRVAPGEDASASRWLVRFPGAIGSPADDGIRWERQASSEAGGVSFETTPPSPPLRAWEIPIGHLVARDEATLVAAARACQSIEISTEAPDQQGATTTDWASLLSSEDVDQQLLAAEVIGRAGPTDSQVLQALHDALRNSSERIRWAAVWALGELGAMGSAEVLSDLRSALEDPGTDVRAAAAMAISRLTSPDPAAIAALEQARHDPAEDVRDAAAWALDTLTQRGDTDA